jgi:hypothetical protein
LKDEAVPPALARVTPIKLVALTGKLVGLPPHLFQDFLD